MTGPIARAPLLRSPPFPWVAPERAAISCPMIEMEPIGSALLDRLIAAMRAARVGGSFWASPVSPGRAGQIVIRAHDPDQARRSAGMARDRADQATVALLPDAEWAHGVSEELNALGIDTIRGEIDPWSLLVPGTRLIAPPDDEWMLLAAAAGVEVDGVSEDALRAALGHALGAARYRDCFTDSIADAERAIAILAGWRRTLDANRAIAVATGMAWWKREAVGRFFWTGRTRLLDFVDDAGLAVDRAKAAAAGIAVWPSRSPAGLYELAARDAVPTIAVEDGFIRSVGLGADLHPPLSIVADARGIYYDPTRPSDLETILETAEFPPALLARADLLAELIIARGISKYGSAAPVAHRRRPDDRRTVLVAGQVEDDMSVRLGGGGVAGNLDLLRRARTAEPGARILFKPHPDVDAGHRHGRVPDAMLLEHADAIVRSDSMPSLLARVDAVHILTSLTGFEALLRGVEVITHGHPFFAGWGLTRDLAGSVPRRTRRLALAELVAGTLILYPRYLDPVTGLPCPPEILLDRLGSGWRPPISWLVRLRRLQGRIAKLLGTVSA